MAPVVISGADRGAGTDSIHGRPGDPRRRDHGVVRGVARARTGHVGCGARAWAVRRGRDVRGGRDARPRRGGGVRRGWAWGARAGAALGAHVARIRRRAGERGWDRRWLAQDGHAGGGARRRRGARARAPVRLPRVAGGARDAYARERGARARAGARPDRAPRVARARRPQRGPAQRRGGSAARVRAERSGASRARRGARRRARRERDRVAGVRRRTGSRLDVVVVGEVFWEGGAFDVGRRCGLPAALACRAGAVR